MGLKYEMTQDVYHHLYVSRTETEGEVIIGNMLNMITRFAPRRHATIARQVMQQGNHTSMNRNTTYKLIGLTFQNNSANERAWQKFWALADKDEKVYWVTEMGELARHCNLDQDHIQK